MIFKKALKNHIFSNVNFELVIRNLVMVVNRDVTAFTNSSSKVRLRRM